MHSQTLIVESLDPLIIYLLSGEIVKAMKEFDWMPYAKKAGVMMGELQNRLAGAPSSIKCNKLEDNLLQVMQHELDKKKPKAE